MSETKLQTIEKMLVFYCYIFRLTRMVNLRLYQFTVPLLQTPWYRDTCTKNTELSLPICPFSNFSLSSRIRLFFLRSSELFRWLSFLHRSNRRTDENYPLTGITISFYNAKILLLENNYKKLPIYLCIVVLTKVLTIKITV